MKSSDDQQNSANPVNESTNRLSRDGFAAVAIALIAAVLIFVMFKHFVS